MWQGLQPYVVEPRRVTLRASQVRRGVAPTDDARKFAMPPATDGADADADAGAGAGAGSSPRPSAAGSGRGRESRRGGLPPRQ